MVDEIELIKRDGPMIYIDNVANTGPMLYRVLSVGLKSSIGSDVGSAVAYNKSLKFLKEVDRRNKFCVISSRITDLGIELSVSKLSEGVKFVSFQRKNLSRF